MDKAELFVSLDVDDILQEKAKTLSMRDVIEDRSDWYTLKLVVFTPKEIDNIVREKIDDYLEYELEQRVIFDGQDSLKKEWIPKIMKYDIVEIEQLDNHLNITFETFWPWEDKMKYRGDGYDPW